MSTIGKRLLLIDDDKQLVAVLALRLKHLGYSVDGVNLAREGYRRALGGSYDTIILDMSMPGLSGLQICNSLRAHGVTTPILILSGVIDKRMIVRGLNAGADDYLTKPFSTSEFMARIRALQRRTRKAFTAHQMQHDSLVLDMPLRLLRSGDKQIVLTRNEALLFKRLLAEAPTPVPRLELLQDVWDIGDTNASNRLDVYIRRLRSKLDALGDGRIRTARGVGYYFDKA